MSKGCDKLGDVKDAAATNTYYAVGIKLSCLLHDSVEIVECRFCQDVLENLNMDTCCFQFCQCRFYQWQDGGCRQYEQTLQSHLFVIIY